MEPVAMGVALMTSVAPFDYLEATVDSVHAAMRSGRITCRQLVEVYLMRIGAYDPSREPSGSSSGSGVAVAANFAMLGVGEDTLGSIRGPAARNCLVGLRPTVPLVSRFGMMPAAPTRDTLGPIARTVRDTAIL